jgi:acyl-homoserine-lactone acylase
MKILVILLLFPILAFSQNPTAAERARYDAQAKRVTIIRDTWGVPHIYGKSDADAVFGLLYAQCEENFSKVEENNLEMLGRLAEIQGEEQVYSDLQMQMIYDTAAAKRDFKTAPQWLQKLMIAAADGVNYYLLKHPEIKPAVLTHFEPWFALLRTNGSISATQTGGITVGDMRSLYPVGSKSTSAGQPNRNSFGQPTTNSIQNNAVSFNGTSSQQAEALGTANSPIIFNDRSLRQLDDDPVGSNGFAIGASKSASGNPLLYINPHVTFYFRSEVQMVSEEGLNAYGAVTWGTFFVFQGFNETCGWMHTSGSTDVADLFTEKVSRNNNTITTKYDGENKPVTTKPFTIRYKTANGIKEHQFTTYKSFHGPVMGMRNGSWLSLRENNRSMTALIQSWNRTKCKSFDDFKKNMDLRSNASDNTVFADNKGNIAYWHGNFIPKRNKDLDYSSPVDGSISSTDSQAPHKLDETVHVYNPASGFIQNCNSNPFTSSGVSSPKPIDYLLYMAPDGENFRGINAVRLLTPAKGLDINRLISEIGYDRYLAAFDVIIPQLLIDNATMLTNNTSKLKDTTTTLRNATTPNNNTDLPKANLDTLKDYLTEPMAYLSAWDRYVSDTSIAAAIAIEFAYRFQALTPRAVNSYKATDAVAQLNATINATTPMQRMTLLIATLNDIKARFGTWKTPWGSINRYQRTDDGKFNDAAPSIPVGLAASAFGALPSFASRKLPGMDKRYGFSGNSFIAAVEFGKKVKAKSVITGGQSFDPKSKHFTDQAQMYIDGKFKDVFFYKDDVTKHIERQYHPGE